jgi:hypothetical protein
MIMETASQNKNNQIFNNIAPEIDQYLEVVEKNRGTSNFAFQSKTQEFEEINLN